MPMHNHRDADAAERYAAMKAEIEAELKGIAGSLEAHAARAARLPRSYSAVADLSLCAQLLAQAREMLG